jgi:uncharacterized protein (TIGR02145 family)
MKKIIIAGLLCMGSAVCAAQTLTVCASASYTIPNVEGVPDATYEWWENGVKVSGTGAAYTNTAGKPAAGTYVYVRRAHTAACGWQSSNPFFVYVTGPVATPVINTPADGCVGVGYVFTVPVVSGTTYEWTGGGTANGNSYTYSNTTAGAMTVTVRATANVDDMVCQSAVAGATVTAYAKPSFTIQPAGTAVCSDSTATLRAAASNATAYQWYKNNAATTEGSGYASQTYTTAAMTATATYSVVATNGGACSTTSNDAVVSITAIGCCTLAGATDYIDWFFPCSDAAIGTEWYLADMRESSNPQTYTVRKMKDGGIWMVQDLRFGNLCNKNTFNGTRGADQTGNLSTEYPQYIGDCRTVTSQGYLYDWPAAIQFENVCEYCGGILSCTPAPGAKDPTHPCAGICPELWHIPSMTEFEALLDSYNYSTDWYEVKHLLNDTHFGASYHGYCNTAGGLTQHNGTECVYWTNDNILDYAHVYQLETDGVNRFGLPKSFGATVRCVRNH